MLPVVYRASGPCGSLPQPRGLLILMCELNDDYCLLVSAEGIAKRDVLLDGMCPAVVVKDPEDVPGWPLMRITARSLMDGEQDFEFFEHRTAIRLIAVEKYAG